MEALDRLSVLRGEILKEIERAAATGQSSDILAGGRKLEAVEGLIARGEEFKRDVESFLKGQSPLPSERKAPGRELGREGGERARQVIVEMLDCAGVPLRRIKGAMYLAPSGAHVGIAYATQRQPDRWFLGLTEGSFEYAILLCEEKPEIVHAIWLSYGFFKENGRKLSRSGNGVKFNVSKSGSTFYLGIPGQGHVHVPLLSAALEVVKQLLASK